VVQKFNGTSWNQIGTNVGSITGFGGIFLGLNSSAEPYVGYPDGALNTYVVQKFPDTTTSPAFPQSNKAETNEVSVEEAVTGIGTHETNHTVVFPNPTNSKIQLDINSPYNKAIVKIIDITGQVVSIQSFEKTEIIKTSLDGDDGFYIIEIVTDRGLSERRKVIKSSH